MINRLNNLFPSNHAFNPVPGLLIWVILFIFFWLFALGSAEAQSVDHWETIVATGDAVKYFVPESELPDDWHSPDFDDSYWTDGISGIGFGDYDDGTNISGCISVYVRYSFAILDLTVIESLMLDMDYDDAFVAYLNGTEIARANIGPAYSPTQFDQYADSSHEAGLYLGIPPQAFLLDSTALVLLQLNENVFSIEVHNDTYNSADLSSNAFLHAGINVEGTYYNPVPDWFIDRGDTIVFSGKLPVMVINTLGQNIPNVNRIVADMGLIDNGGNNLNHPDDPLNNYDGKISIEVRGSSSQQFPKQSYSFETQHEDGSNNNVSLLDLPPENDWVLYAPYSDKSLVRNVITHRIFEEMGHWAPHNRFVDLYINQKYKGIYVLIEKIKQDENRVDIEELDESDISPIEISGGYILQVDRLFGLVSEEYWTSPTIPPYDGFSQNSFEYYDPEFDDLSFLQSNYIKEWINNLDEVLASDNYQDENSGYRAYIDAESFVDYLILHEFVKDVDAYEFSTFFYKTNDSNGGKLHAGPTWDYNLTYGNVNYKGHTGEIYNWMYPFDGSMYWFQRLMEDPWFENKVFCRWDEVKESILNEYFINDLIDSSVVVMDTSIDYNFQKWPILGEYIWPNSYIGDTHEEEIVFLKNWITDRLEWMDEQWGNHCEESGINILKTSTLSLTIVPNPSDLSNTKIIFPKSFSKSVHLSIANTDGREIISKFYVLGANSQKLSLEDLSWLDEGIYFLEMTDEYGHCAFGKLVKK